MKPDPDLRPDPVRPAPWMRPDLRSIIAPATFCTAEQSKHAADAIERAFVLIPRSECETIRHDYELSVEVVRDAANIDRVHATITAGMSAYAFEIGFLVIGRPTRAERPMDERTGMVGFHLSALAWRLPDQDPTDETHEDGRMYR